MSVDGIVWQPDYAAHAFPRRGDFDCERYGLLTFHVAARAER